MARTNPIFTVFAITLVTLPTSANAYTIGQSVGIASSPNPVGSGARALGMGGAFIALADDATAASWNPGALIQLEKPEISIVGDFFHHSDDFSSSLHPEINHSTTSNDFNLNYFSVTCPFNLFNRNMVASVNYQRLYDFRRELEYDLELNGSTPMATIFSSERRRYEQDGSVGALGLAYSLEITYRFSIGFTLNLWTGDLFWDNGWDETYTNHSMTTFWRNTVVEDTMLTDEYSDFRGINANVGFLWDINQYLSVGGVLKTPFTADVDHSFSEHWTLSDTNGNVLYSNIFSDSETVELEMPLSAGLGMAVRFTDAFSMGIDVYYTKWEAYTLTDGRGNELSPIDSRPQDESNVHNTTQVRLGGEYLFINLDRNWIIPLRGGLFYDPEPAQDKVKDFYGLSIGSGISYKQCSIDLAYQFRWANDVDTANLITTSEADMQQHQVLLSLIYYF